MIYTRRVYDTQGQDRGKTFLVDRIWPRGIKKSELKVDAWLKDTAPSTRLRRWFHRQPEKWREFEEQYFRELEGMPGAWEPIFKAAGNGDVTLLYSSRDIEHNNAVALKAFLGKKLENSRKQEVQS